LSGSVAVDSVGRSVVVLYRDVVACPESIGSWVLNVCGSLAEERVLDGGLLGSCVLGVCGLWSVCLVPLGVLLLAERVLLVGAVVVFGAKVLIG